MFRPLASTGFATVVAMFLHVIAGTATAQTTVFKNATVIPMDSERVLQGMDVFVDGDRIVSVDLTGRRAIPSDAKVIDASGKFLMPGLAEMHGHVPPTQGGNFPQRYVEDVLFLYLAGPSFSGNTVNSPDEAANRVKQQVAEGWDLLKVHPGLTLDEYTAMATTAKELGIPFAGHIPDDVGLENAIKLGQQTIDHLDGYMSYASGMNAPVNEAKLAEIEAAYRD